MANTGSFIGAHMDDVQRNLRRELERAENVLTEFYFQNKFQYGILNRAGNLSVDELTTLVLRVIFENPGPDQSDHNGYCAECLLACILTPHNSE